MRFSNLGAHPRYGEWAGTPIGVCYERARSQTVNLDAVGLVVIWRLLEGVNTKWGKTKSALNCLGMPTFVSVFSQTALGEKMLQQAKALLQSVEKYLAEKKKSIIPPREETAKIWRVTEHEFAQGNRRHKTQLILTVGYYHLKDAQDSVKLALTEDQLMVELRYRSTLHKANEKLPASQVIMRHDGFAYKAPLPHFLNMLRSSDFKAKVKRMGDFVSLRILNSADVRGIKPPAFQAEDDRVDSESDDENVVVVDRKRRRNDTESKMS